MELRISPTLLDAWEWYKHCPASWKSRALDDIKAKINRAPFVETPAIRKGRAFEDAVEAVAESVAAGGECKGSELFQSVVKRCLGGTWQTWQRGSLNVGEDYDVVNSVGKLDVLFPIGHPQKENGHIIDLKTTAKYRGADKYLNGWQHKFYCHWMNIPTFDYIVAEWESDDPDNKTIQDVHVIQCEVNLLTVQEELRNGVRGFFAFLKTQGLWDSYLYVYSKNKR